MDKINDYGKIFANIRQRNETHSLRNGKSKQLALDFKRFVEQQENTLKKAEQSGYDSKLTIPSSKISNKITTYYTYKKGEERDTLRIKHDNNLISTYQGLKNVNVVKGDRVVQNTVIGTSGEISLDKKLDNALLFELNKDGKYVNPEKYYDLNPNEL
jgi:hypothetical protein